MTEKTVLRIYMPISAKFSGPRTFWQTVFGPSLAGSLLKRAKEFGVEQAVFQRIMGGYLKGKKIAFEQGEAVPPDLPQCVELIDKEDTIKRFVAKYKDQFGNCRLIMLHAFEVSEAHGA